MIFGITPYKYLFLAILLAVCSVVSTMAQNGIAIYEGDQKAYRVTNHSGSSYLWTIYNDPVFKNKASGTEVKIVSGENNSSLVVTWLKAGMYYISLLETDQYGCTNTKALAINVYPVSSDKPTARIAGPPLVTFGGCDTRGHVLDASGSLGEGLSFAWSPAIYLDNPSIAKPIFTPGKTTRYHLTVTNSRNQTDTTSVLIAVAGLPKAITDKNVFVNSNSTAVLLNGGKSTGSGLTYLWQSTDGVILSGETIAVAQVRGLGKYFLKVTDSFGCTSLDSVEVGLYTQAVRDTGETKLNFSVDIDILANDIPKGKLNPATLRIVSAPKNGMATISGESIVTYTPNQYFVGSDDFIYSICDYFQHCDQATVLVLVNDLPFFIPEAFSPNGDGINDQFVINGLAKYKNVEIEIFNRWGNVVYRSANYGEGQGKSGFWDGTVSQGVRFGTGPVPSGTYFYVLKLDGKQKINGTVYLDR